jgi:hypothetical protein
MLRGPAPVSCAGPLCHIAGTVYYINAVHDVLGHAGV